MARCDECLWSDGTKCHNASHPDYGKNVAVDGWCSFHPQSVQYEVAVWPATNVPVGWEPFAVLRKDGNRVVCRHAIAPA